MVKIVEITQSSDTVICDNNGKATIQYNVTNITSSSLRVGVDITPDDPSQKSWFSLEGKSEKQLDANATDQFSVEVDAKPSESEIISKVSILVYSVENSDENYTESEPVTIKVPSTTVVDIEDNSNNKWIIWVLVGIVILALSGVIGYLLLKDNPAAPPQTETETLAIIPNVSGKTFEQAKNELELLEFFNIETSSVFDANKAENTVLEQKPEAGTKSNTSETITLVLANSLVEMPDVIDKTFQGTLDNLKALGFKQINEEPEFNNSKPAKTILKQSPEPGSSVNSSTTVVTLTVADSGIEIPNLKGKNVTDALQILQNIGLGTGKITQKAVKGKKENTILDHTPKAKKQVENGTAVALVVAAKVPVKPTPGRPVMTLATPIFNMANLLAVTTKCAQAVQGKIAWDYKGNKQWAPNNIKRLCKGAETSAEPAICFNRVMHGRINWGSSTKWQWKNAIDLCEGSKSSSRTISCFQREISRRTPWSTAIKKCS